jgi:hypothetical protein
MLTSFAASDVVGPDSGARFLAVIELPKATRRGPEGASSSALSQDGKGKGWLSIGEYL